MAPNFPAATSAEGSGSPVNVANPQSGMTDHSIRADPPHGGVGLGTSIANRLEVVKRLPHDCQAPIEVSDPNSFRVGVRLRPNG